jgi:hypothetical protein
MGRLVGSLRPLLTLLAAPFGAPRQPRRTLTKAEWQAGTDLVVLLDFLHGRAGERQLRLFAAACCRRVLDLLPDARSRHAVDVFERHAEGLAGAGELRAALVQAWSAGENAASYLASEEPFLVAFRAALDRARAAHPERVDPGREKAEVAAQCDLLRDVCNPFHPGILDDGVPSWNGGAVPRLARAVYDGRRFEDLPILADALEEAGCTDAELLAHCRGPGPHARGCWALDLVLGRD